MEYSVGLDIGTGSVGWAVIDDNYQVPKVRNKNLMGVRLFGQAETAEKRRMYRTTRRRLSRRRWRVRLLNEIFAPELAKWDPNFIPRLKYTWVHQLDEQNKDHYYGGSIFGNSKADHDFYKKYPTIYHLRQALINDEDQHDLREVYLAIHHIVKYRGHFLIEGKINPTDTFDINLLKESLESFSSQNGNIFEILNLKQVNDGLQNFNNSKTSRVEEAIKGIKVGKKDLPIIKAILMAIVGNTVNLIKIFNKEEEVDKEDQNSYKFKFSDENLEETIEGLSSNLSEDEMKFVNDMRTTYDGLMLRSILQDSKSVSEAMVKSYESHKKDLKTLKQNFRSAQTKKEFDESYLNLLSHSEEKRGKGKKYFKKLIVEKIVERFGDENGFDEIKKVITNEKSSEEELQRKIVDLTEIVKSRVNKLLPNAIEDHNLVELLNKIIIDRLLPTQRNKNNGVIPHQLHQNELVKILEKQGKYYPFLNDKYSEEDKTLNKIEKLLTFRVPYYVGPLVEKAKVEGNSDNHWLERNKEGQITPWNMDEKVNLDSSARNFIERMTIKDTYLINENVIPSNTLTYQAYTVLQELNNVRIQFKGKTSKKRLDIKQKQNVYNNFFKTYTNVTKTMVEEYLNESEGIKIEISGLASKNKFNNSLKTYNYFVKIFGRDFVEARENEELLDEIVKIQTIFEDRKLIKRQLTKLKGLTEDQINKLSKKHYTGWGRLSRSFLKDKKIHTKLDGDTKDNDYSILDLLYRTEKNLMEIINFPDYGVDKWLKEENGNHNKKNNTYQAIDELAGAPNIKRGIRQSFRVLDDIKKAMGGVSPKNVYLEFARETQASKITNSRIKRLKALYANKEIKNEFASVAKELAKESKETVKDDRLYLYYLQLGRDMYTGDKISIDEISVNCDIDHIVPQAYTKDNSLDNRVLVRRTENARKSDSPAYVPEIIEKCLPFWTHLLNLGLISHKKFDSLKRKGDFNESQKERFIARSLVETRQIIKNVAVLIENHYEGKTKAVAIRASLTGDMRKYTHKPKNRDINDYHHAHDALLIATVGQYIQRRGFDSHGEFTYDEFNRYTKDWMKAKRNEGKNNERIYPYGFIVGSMQSHSQKQKANRETGEVVWTEENYQYLLKQLEERDLLFTKKNQDSKGQLYKETRRPSKLNCPKTTGKQPFNAKQSLELYGGFDSIQLAYSILIYYKKKFQLFGIKRLWVSDIKKDPKFLDRKIQEFAPGAKIILDHIPSEQEIIINGAKMTIGSATELHNAQQLYLERKLYKNLTTILKSDTEAKADARLKGSSKEILIKAFDAIVKEMKEHFPMHDKQLNKLEGYRDDFEKLEFEDQKNIINGVLSGLHANSTSTQFKFCSNFGRFNLSGGYKLTPEDAFVYNSPAGIYQRIVKVKDLPGVAELI